jgi:hypothetical protein
MEKLSKKKLIYSVWVELFWKYWVKRVSIDMIVKEAWIAKWTYYLYYENKLELYEKIIDDILNYWKEFMLYLSKNISDKKERFLQHMIWSLKFFENNKIIKNLIDSNSDYYLWKINHKYLFEKHIELMTILLGDDFSDKDFIYLVSNVKWFFMEVLNKKWHFKNTKEYQKFVLNLASIIVNWLFSNYKLLINNRNYSDFVFDCKKSFNSETKIK